MQHKYGKREVYKFSKKTVIGIDHLTDLSIGGPGLIIRRIKVARGKVNWQVLVKTEQSIGFHAGRLSSTAPIRFSIAVLHHGVNNLLSSLETSNCEYTVTLNPTKNVNYFGNL
jgi:hypothetical protein